MNPELAELFGMGGGAPPAEDAGGLPPDIMSLLQGGGDPEAGAGRPSVAEGEPGAGEEPLTVAIDAIQEAIDAESDQEDIQVMLQCQAKLQSILAKNQSEQDGMMQGKASPRSIRKATAGASY